MKEKAYSWFTFLTVLFIFISIVFLYLKDKQFVSEYYLLLVFSCISGVLALISVIRHFSINPKTAFSSFMWFPFILYLILCALNVTINKNFILLSTMAPFFIFLIFIIIIYFIFHSLLWSNIIVACLFTLFFTGGIYFNQVSHENNLDKNNNPETEPAIFNIFTFEDLFDDNLRLTGLQEDYKDSENITRPDYYNKKKITKIKENTFKDNGNIKTVTFGQNIIEVEKEAFINCVNLTEVKLNNSLETIADNVFDNCKNLKTISIPNSVKSIGVQAFQNCTNLNKVTLPNSLEKISRELFLNCGNLDEITIPESVTEIGSSSFRNTKLTSVTIPKSVKNIYAGAFNTNSLKEAVLESKSTNYNYKTVEDGPVFGKVTPTYKK
jgi:hypothetical protein